MLTKIYKNGISLNVIQIIINFKFLIIMVQNTFATVTVENAVVVLNSLKSLGRPLTHEEKIIGRKAALLFGKTIKDQVNASRDAEIKFLVERGYTEEEARKQLRLNARIHNEEIGLGKSQRCKFTRVRNKSKKFTKAC